jgi:hypothetical protein
METYCVFFAVGTELYNLDDFVLENINIWNSLELGIDRH